MLTVNEIAENICLKNLIDPYTGQAMEVRVISIGSVFMYSAPEAYSPSEWRTSMEELLRLASSRNGVAGAAGEDPVCAYTGKTLVLENDPELGFRLVGGWDPTLPLSSPELFAYRARMRDGKADPSAPEPEPRKPVSVKVLGVREEPEPRRPPISISDDVGAAAEETIAGLKKTAGIKKTSVTVRGTKKARK